MICQHCGCTDEQPCPGGCYWVAPNICSDCAQEALLAEIKLSVPAEWRDPQLLFLPIAFQITLLEALAIHGNLALALRHPQNMGASTTLIEDILSPFEAMFEEIGMPAPEGGWRTDAPPAPRIIIPTGGRLA